MRNGYNINMRHGNWKRGPVIQPTDNLPNRLRYLRLRAGLTLQQLAAEIGVHYQHLGLAERTGIGIHRHAWYRLARYYGVSPEVLETPMPPTAEKINKPS